MKNKFLSCVALGVLGFFALPFFAQALTIGSTINVEGSDIRTNPVYVPNTLVLGNAVAGYTAQPVSPQSIAYITQHRRVSYNIPGFWRGNPSVGTWVGATCDGEPVWSPANSVSGGTLQYNHFSFNQDTYISSTCYAYIVDFVETSLTNLGGMPAWQYWTAGYYYAPGTSINPTFFPTGLYFRAYASQSEIISDGVFVDFVPPSVTDVCANVSGNQSSVPADMYADGGNCYYYPPVITFTPPTPADAPLCTYVNFSWTTQYAQYGCGAWGTSGSSQVISGSQDGVWGSTYSVSCSGYGGNHASTFVAIGRTALGNNCAPPPPTQCSDGSDNDSDGLTDYPSDPECDNASDDDESPAPSVPQCQDGIDNDSDGQTDYPSDIGCADYNDDDEFNVVVLPQCSDSIDNDGDGLIDYPNDAGCANTLDTDETNPVIPPSPALSFTANDYTPSWGSATNLNWTAQNVTSCTASGDWSGSKGLSGTESTGAMWWNKTFILTCTGAYGSIAKTVSIGLSGTSACSDSIDNDGDGLIDYGGDPGCDDIMDDDETNAGSDVCPNLAGNQSSVPSGYSLDGLGNCIVTVTQCSDGSDNDSDGFTDYPSDLDCLSLSDIDESGPLGGGPQCSDGIDNDGDTLVDTNDPDCHTDGNPGNGGSYDPGDTNETNSLVPGFTLGSSENIKIVFASSGSADSEAKTVSPNPVGGFTGNVTLSLGAISPALPMGTTVLYSFNGGAFSASPSITIPYNGSASLKVRISNKVTSTYTVTLTGSSAGFSDSSKQYTIVPTTIIPVFEEY